MVQNGGSPAPARADAAGDLREAVGTDLGGGWPLSATDADGMMQAKDEELVQRLRDTVAEATHSGKERPQLTIVEVVR